MHAPSVVLGVIAASVIGVAGFYFGSVSKGNIEIPGTTPDATKIQSGSTITPTKMMSLAEKHNR